ncbi:superoxide dismutase, Fe-Mn family [Bryocella elongata]|uniref:Superoxide dismutase n=2 Tax=Bryocella elongata TaxID=863522 RepID=A0A1H6C358_9BACT|nr:superoxide dismutase, Fe-Mn family [Bryocella elongata]
MDRREAIKTLGLTAGFVAAGARLEAVTGAQAPVTTGPFTLPPLPYAYDALEPYIDAETMHLHHDKHHASYVANLNAAVAGHPELGQKTVEQLVTNLNAVPEDVRTAVRNQGGGHANHSFFWQLLSQKGGAAPVGRLKADVNARFGSQGQFQEKFAAAAASVFGSGWAWLTLSHQGVLEIETTANQDSPLSRGVTPILGLDVWEHAYYLKYQNRRAEYVAAFFHAVNWDGVSEKYFSQRAACDPQLPCQVHSYMD